MDQWAPIRDTGWQVFNPNIQRTLTPLTPLRDTTAVELIQVALWLPVTKSQQVTRQHPVTACHPRSTRLDLSINLRVKTIGKGFDKFLSPVIKLISRSSRKVWRLWFIGNLSLVFKFFKLTTMNRKKPNGSMVSNELDERRRAIIVHASIADLVLALRKGSRESLSRYMYVFAAEKARRQQRRRVKLAWREAEIAHTYLHFVN